MDRESDSTTKPSSEDITIKADKTEPMETWKNQLKKILKEVRKKPEDPSNIDR